MRALLRGVDRAKEFRDVYLPTRLHLISAQH
jgi:hypothetical protein